MFVNSNVKGAVAEMAIAKEAALLGVPVLVPLTEHGRFDMGLEIGGDLLRVQCKWGRRHGEVIVVNLNSSRLTPAGYVRTTYDASEVDLVAVYCGDLDRCYLLPDSLFVGRRAVQLRLAPPLNGQRACINLATDYEFAGAVAQLAERRRGTPEARGSNPLSSTPSPPGETVVGAHEFRCHFGWYAERAAAGEEIVVTRRGRPHLRLLAAA